MKYVNGDLVQSVIKWKIWNVKHWKIKYTISNFRYENFNIFKHSILQIVYFYTGVTYNHQYMMTLTESSSQYQKCLSF